MRLLIPSNNILGCGNGGDIKVPSYYPSSRKFVLLLERGKCTYKEKILQAQNVGASAVIIANTVKAMYGKNDYAATSDVNCENGEAWIKEDVIVSSPYAPQSENFCRSFN